MAADLVIKGGWVVTPDATFKGGVAISNQVIVAIGDDASLPEGKEVIDVKGKHILPGLFDGHVHFREPGMTHKEDFNTGSTAAVCGGITTVVDMPNTVPPTADAEQVKVKKELGEAKSLVDFGITGVVVQTNTKDILPMAAAGVIGYKIFFGETIGNLPFPDDGMCVEAFDYIAQSKLPLGIHAENRQIMAYYTNKLKTEGKNEARYWEASRPDICEAESVHHAIFFAETFGTKLHVFHMSSKQAAYMVRDAKARGMRITAETGPHYLLREPNDMDKVGSLLKMNPPVRTKDHAEVLWQGLREGFVDTLATDHSPHTLDEKGSDIYGKLTKPAIWDCISGFCGVETGVPLILTEVNKGRLTSTNTSKWPLRTRPKFGRSIRRKAPSAWAPTATSPSSTWTRKAPSTSTSCTARTNPRLGMAGKSKACRCSRSCAATCRCETASPAAKRSAKHSSRSSED